MNLALEALKLILLVWDFLTYPLYQAIYMPWKNRAEDRRVRARVLHQHTTPGQVVFEAPEKSNKVYDEFAASKASTAADSFAFAAAKYKDRPFLGTREIIREEDEVQANGKMFKKYHLGDYRWISFEEAEATAGYVGRGLSHLGLSAGQNVAIFADTRAEWFLTAQACFKHSFPLVTLYTNLGEDAVVYGVNQTEATVVVTSHELLPKFRTILKSTPTVRSIVYFEHQVRQADLSGYDDVDVVPFYELVNRGRKLARKASHAPSPPTGKDTAIIMYTSGSTGSPKGVILSHRNILSILMSMLLTLDIDRMNCDYVYIAYLPLAHILELLVESTLSIYGCMLGYSSPNTLTDKSTLVKKGCKGDATILRPTIMAGVPLILDRIYKAINENIQKKGKTFGELFEFALSYRLKAYQKGEPAPIMDRLLFRALRLLLGGRMRIIISGGAPLSPETHNFIRAALRISVMQGYGLTETGACATLMERRQLSRVGTVGPPNQGVQIKLINWEEGNYRVTDKPHPRGEIVVGGNCVAEGYYLMEEKTNEDFYNEHGRRWFRTGDIGQMDDQGNLMVIDRKKDLVKLQFGEYVSLGKVEAVLKTCEIVENVCIYGDSTKSFCVALVTPDRPALGRLAKHLGKEDLDLQVMCRDKDVTGASLRELVHYGKKMRLEKFELPGALTLIPETWTPDSGLVTAAFKLKRKPIQDKYQVDIDRMYRM